MNERTCSRSDCDRKHYAKGFCQPHYYRAKNGASVEQMAAPIADRAPSGAPTTCRHTDRKNYAHGLCHPCYQTIHNKPWRARNRAKLAMGARARRHGMAPAELEAIWERQAGKCANPRCGATFELYFSDHRNGLQIDHDHLTGSVRGLLCKPCNTALGHINDDADRLLGLIEYIQGVRH